MCTSSSTFFDVTERKLPPINAIPYTQAYTYTKKNQLQATSHIAYFSIFYFNFNLLTPTGYVMHQQFNIQQLYVLPTLYLCVLYLSENKQRLVPLTA